MVAEKMNSAAILAFKNSYAALVREEITEKKAMHVVGNREKGNHEKIGWPHPVGYLHLCICVHV